MAASALGTESTIEYKFFFGLPIQGHTSYGVIEPWAAMVADFSGGLYAGLWMLIIWYWAWRSKTLHDTNIEVAAAISAWYNISGGIAEGFLNNSITEIQIISTISVLIGLIVVHRKVLSWWKDDYVATGKWISPDYGSGGSGATNIPLNKDDYTKT